MNVVELHPEHLFDALRAGKLSAPERARLEAHCAHCTACLFELRWLEESPLAPQPTAADRAYGEAAFDNVLRASGARRAPLTKRSAGWPLKLGVAGVLLASAMGLTLLLTRSREVEPARPTPSVAPPVDVPYSPPPPPPPPSSAPEPEENARKTPSANQLLAAARRAQTHKQLDRAERLYRQVIETYATTTAAGAAQIALARLLYTERSQPKAALPLFDAYLQRRPNGSLAEEALFYRALTLEQLGDKTRAAASLRELLSTFPSSLYAAPARVHLEREPEP